MNVGNQGKCKTSAYDSFWEESSDRTSETELGIVWNPFEMEMGPFLISSAPSSCKPAEFNKPAVIKCQMAAFSRVGK